METFYEKRLALNQGATNSSIEEVNNDVYTFVVFKLGLWGALLGFTRSATEMFKVRGLRAGAVNLAAHTPLKL